MTLTFADGGPLPIDVRSLQPMALSGLSRSEIEKLPLIAGNRTILLGDLCTVECTNQDESELIFEGATARLTHAGHGMDGGKLVIAGGAGNSLGAGMHAGEINILGSAGDCLGQDMQGGLIRVQGSAGDWCGASWTGQVSRMSGGIILVGRDTGRETGAGMRRGLIYVSGNAGDYAGARMQAGSLLVAGKVELGAGLGMRRGSLVTGKLERRLPGFSPAGPADDEWLRIYFRCLGKLGISTPAGWLEGGLHRFSGDSLEWAKEN